MGSSGAIYYTVFAYDLKGEFTVRRRYNDFASLRESWLKRLTGLYVPSLPPKKIFVRVAQ
jgi:hypothetical protein